MEIPFTVDTYVSDKQWSAVIIHNNRPIDIFSSEWIKTQRNYTTP